jgi:pyruvate dehydrogenase E2 component (dihydrolipoamide acetyltransferase)
MRRTIARRLQQSKQQLPHYYVRIDATVDAVIEQREQHGGASVNAFVLKATALALQAVPALNVHFDGDRVTQSANADICVAVATEAGLITPVLRSAQDKSVVEIHNETKVLAERARNGALNRDEIEGGSFTVSNLGMFGVSDFTAIINPPQVGILAVGAAERRPVVRDEQVVPATMTTLTLSADHRVIDGAVAAEFLATLKGALENPVNL